MDWLDQYIVKTQYAHVLAAMNKSFWIASTMELNLLVDFGNLTEASMNFENADPSARPVPPEAVRRYRAYKSN